MQKLIVTWPEVEQLVDELAILVRHKTYRAIYAVPRGGFVIAGMLAHRIEVKYLFSTTHQEKINPRMAADYLVVDDICDTGNTIRSLRRRFPSGLFCTLHTKIAMPRVISVSAVSKDTWVVYPWEKSIVGKVDDTEI